MAPNSWQFSVRNDAIVIRGVHDMATDTSTETRKLEGKLDSLVNLVTQLAANQKPASIARVCDIRSSNDHHASVHHHSSRYKALDREDGFQFLALSATNDAIVIRGVHDVATDTSAEIQELEGKVDALVKLVTHLAANQNPAPVARVCGIRSSNDHHTNVCLSSQQSGVDEHPEAYFSARNNAIVSRGLHDVATDTSAETRKLENKLNAALNLVTHLAANQKPTSVARVCGIRSSNDHHTSVCPSSQQSGEAEHPEAYATNTYSRPPQPQRQDTSVETRKLEGKLDTIVNLFSARNETIIIRGVHDVAIDTSAETRKLEAKLDALVNLVTQLAGNEKPASVAKVYGIRSSNDHHTSVYPSSHQSEVDEHPEAYAANTYNRPPQQQRQDT
ncbi:hypothetical protein Fmac_032790 [Flemingia macrophylla]|uniref:Uncharacterized protein n=1 Tax=Flemingia macrophylla TaxID=520843 RepID=A0ABD1L5Y7_9FABA